MHLAGQTVYPRVYGGTGQSVDLAALYARPGLSPRVRGNRIPYRSSRAASTMVYPRVYGGTSISLPNR